MAKKFLKQIKDRPLLVAAATAIGFLLLKLLFLSYRIRIKNALPDTDGIFWTWHQDIVATTAFFSKKSLAPYYIVSGSKDGLFVGSILERFGNRVLYGSSHKNPITLTRQALAVLQKNHKQLFLVGDGSRGPAKKLQGGPAYLAQKANLPLIFINCEVSRKIVFTKTWDQFQIPLPFSTITITLQKTCLLK